MSETTGEQERARDLDRLLTFVDAIVAIAVTLLVLPLVDLAQGFADGGSVSGLLHENEALIWAFFLSFAVISNLWLTQHRMLRHVIATNDTITRLLMLWSLTIVFLPFPTALVAAPADTGSQAVTKLLYVGSMAVSAIILGCISLAVSRDRSLRDSDDAPDPVRSFGIAVTFVVALAVMLVFPATSYWPLLLLLLSDRVVALLRRTRQHL